jgi:tryptophanyl-tRNA synthetase
VRRSLTGIQPSGTLHLGNLLGCIRPALELQTHHEAYYFVADYHALTSVQDRERLQHESRVIAATYLSFGLDVEKNLLFRQSAVPEVCELAWILACQISTGLLERGHAVKAAKDGGREVNAGTLFYPVLMAADILLYDSDVVPVGSDQKQHVEMARDMAIKLNHRYGDDVLVVPEVSIQEEVGVVPGLDGRKMSSSYGNGVGIWDSPKRQRKLLMKIVTDSKGVDEPKDPETCNVFNLYKLFANPAQCADLADRYRGGGLGYGHAKQEVFEIIDAQLLEPRARYEEWMAHPDRVDAVLAEGGLRARRAANATLARVRGAIGLT